MYLTMATRKYLQREKFSNTIQQRIRSCYKEGQLTGYNELTNKLRSQKQLNVYERTV